MATGSVIAAVMTKYDALTATNFPDNSRPPIYLDSPPTSSAGSQVRVPYVILRDQGTRVVEGGFEHSTIDETEFVFEVYYAGDTPLADVDTAVQAIKLNGGSRATAGGFDYGTLSDLSLLSRSTHAIHRLREQRRYAGFEQDGARVHVCELTYRVTVKEVS